MMNVDIFENAGLTRDQKEHFLSFGLKKQLNRNQRLIQNGDNVGCIYYIVNGLLRGYRMCDGQDVTHHFYRPNWFATDYCAYLTSEPSELFLETLTQVEAYKFSKKTLEKIFNANIKYQAIGRLIAERAFLVMSRRVRQFQLNNLQSRYLELVRDEPELFRQVPQKHIASYLGVAPQSLSRIKSTI